MLSARRCFTLLHPAEGPRPSGSPTSISWSFEIATLEYVDWFNHRRLFEACGDIPPAELEAAHYRQHTALAEVGHSTA